MTKKNQEFDQGAVHKWNIIHVEKIFRKYLCE